MHIKRPFHTCKMGYRNLLILATIVLLVWEHQRVLQQVWIGFASAMIASLNKRNELPEILVLPRRSLNIGQRDGMGCCISDDAVNDLLSHLTCLDIIFGEGGGGGALFVRGNLLYSVYRDSTLAFSQLLQLEQPVFNCHRGGSAVRIIEERNLGWWSVSMMKELPIRYL